MDSKFFDIPFMTRGPESDFICKDGEISLWEGATIKGKNGTLPQHYEELPPVPEIRFALARDILRGWHLNPDNFPMKTLAASDPSMDYWNQLVPRVLSQFLCDADNLHLFVAPFMAAAAWKTVDGNLLSPTAPSLLIPNSEVPLIAADGDIRAEELDFKVAAAV